MNSKYSARDYPANCFYSSMFCLLGVIFLLNVYADITDGGKDILMILVKSLIAVYVLYTAWDFLPTQSHMKKWDAEAKELSDQFFESLASTHSKRRAEVNQEEAQGRKDGGANTL